MTTTNHETSLVRSGYSSEQEDEVVSPDASMDMQAINTLREDVDAQVDRVKSLFQSGQLTDDALKAEFSETFLPLIQDVVARLWQSQANNDRSFIAIEAKLWPNGDDEGDDGDDDGSDADDAEPQDGLFPADAQGITILLTKFRQQQVKMLEANPTPEARTEIEQTIVAIDGCVQRVRDLTIEG